MTPLRALAQWIGLLLLITIVLAVGAMVLAVADPMHEQSHSYRCAMTDISGKSWSHIK